MMESRINVVVIDSHRIIREGICSLLEKSGCISVVEAIDGPDATQRVDHLKPHIVLVNLVSNRTPETLETIRQIRQSSPATLVLILAHSENDQHLLQTLKLGAMGCLLCDSSTEDLVESIREIGRGGAHLPSQISRRLLKRISNSGEENNHDGVQLSHQQLRVLKYISCGYSNKQIAEKILVSTRTVEMHTYQLYKRLNVKSRTQAILMAVQMGIIDLDEITDSQFNNLK